MTHPKELDLGPLTWVKSEIELALNRATESLDQASQATDTPARVQFAQTHLHQVRGALSIVGLDGLTQFATAVDQFLGAMTRGEIPVDAHGIDLGKRTLAAIGNYLEELAHGTPDQPLRLLPLYQEVALARGHTAPSAADLFFPDLSVRAPRRNTDAQQLSAEVRQERIRSLRTRFQRGLLEWLKQPASASGPDTMHAALVELEAVEESPPARALWWVAQAFVETLAQPSGDRGEAKGLLSRIDAQLRRATGTPPAVPERLMREMLYQIACTPATTATQHAIRKLWQLDTLLPESGARVSDIPLAPLLQDLRTRVTSLKQLWDAFSGGEAVALQQFETQLDDFAAPVRRLGRPSVDRLIGSIQQFIAWLRKDPLRFSDAISLELATAVLLAEAALDRSVPDAGFSAQVSDTITRLEALARGENLVAVSNSPGLEAARRAQEKDALAQLSREIITNLASIEQTLDDFFRDQRKRAPLAQLSEPLHQIEGALTLLGETDAISLIHEAGEIIAGFATQDAPADQSVFEELAHRFSALGFFIQSLQHGRTSLQHFLDPEAEAQTAELAQASEEAPGAYAPDHEAEDTAVHPEATPAFEIDTATDLDAAYADEAVAVDAHPDDTPHTPAPAAMPEVATETRRLIEASAEEIDAELLCIFIEEAHEVLATIGEQLELSRTAPTDTAYLTAIRRGFHTLKGSGRMVGLRELGEAAWGLEQTLNRWLQLEWPPTSALHHLIDEAHQHFSAWVVQLEAGGAHHRDVTALIAEAERLRSSDTPIHESAVGEVPVTAEVVATTPAPAAEETGFIETTLEFPDLALSEAGEVLPYAADAEAAAFLPEETSLDELPLFDEDDTPELEAPAPTATEPSATETEAHAVADEDEADDASATIDIGPLLDSIDLELTELEPFPPMEAAEPAHAEAEPPSELLSITALDESWLAPEEEFAPIDSTELDFTEPREPDEIIEALEPPLEALEAVELPAAADAPDLPRTDIEADDAVLSRAPLLPETLFDEVAEDGGEQTEAIELGTSAPAEIAVTEHADDAAEATEAAADGVEGLEREALAPAALVDTAATDIETAEAEAEAEATEVEAEVEDTEVADGEAALEDVASKDEAPTAGADFIQVGEVEVSRPLYDLYLAEAKHHIATLQHDFSRLTANPTLLLPETALRAAHTFAGISGTARIVPLQMLARALEHAEQRLKDLATPPSAADLALFLTVVATLESMLAEVANLRMPHEAPELIEQLEHAGRLVTEPALQAERSAQPSTAPEPADETPVLRVHDEIDEQLLPIFLEEAAELLSDLHTALRKWQADTSNAELPKSTARLLHTLKGSARMAGAMTLGERVHQLESKLEQVSAGGHELPALIEELVGGLDQTEQMIDAIAGGTVEPSAEANLAPAGAQAAGTAVAIDATTAEGETAAGGGTLRVRADLIDRFVNEAGEIGIARTRIDGELRNLRRSMLDLTENVIRLRNQLREVEIQADVQMQSRMAQAESHHTEFDPLEMDRYTRLQELTRMMAESVNDVTTVQQSLLKNLDGADLALHSQARMSRELQQALMRVRMVPFNSLADRLYRIVRQGAKELGKRANLDLRGGRIEVDRSMLEHMVAPLEHLLRNALAHGIEAPDARRAAGKPEIGQLTLTVRQEGNEIAIELSDDGGGLNFERIAARARANGLLGPDEVADENRLINLIFVPGFSTAGQVSAVSGRGVGMDVVKAETAAVGGRIDVSSSPAAGTTFRIYLPLTLAVTQALLVRSGGRHFAIPSSMVAQAREMKAPELERLLAEGGVEWQGQHYAYRYLPRLLGDRNSAPEVQRYNWVLLLRAGAQTLALHVDALRGNQEIVVKNAGPQLTRTVGMSGATVLGDGEIVLIINPVALASRGLGGTESAVGAPPEAPAAPTVAAAHTPTIMVVDDSLTVRKIISRLLEREGYRVITAKDGVDAVEVLIENLPDVILSDIEMPRMDGFDLVRNIRADARTRTVPVIMITSRLAEKHRNYAMEIGANHYLGKPYQEEELLGLIASYVSHS